MKNNLQGKVVSAGTDLLKAIVMACSDSKGSDIQALDVSSSFDLASKFIFVSGRSDRHVQGITNRILEEVRKAGLQPLDVEGYDKAHWVLIDLDEVIVHVFYEPARELFDLDNLWIPKSTVINIDELLPEKKAA